MSDTPAPDRRRWPAWAGYLLAALTLAVIALFLWQSDLLRQIDFRTLRWDLFALVIALEAAAFGLRGLILAAFVAQSGIRLRIIEWFGLAVLSNFANIVLPVSGGAIARAAYLKLRYRYPVSRFSALFAASYLMIFLVSGVSGLVILGGLWLGGGGPALWTAALVLAGMAGGPLALIIAPLERLPLPLKGRILRWARAALEGWREFRTDPALLARVVLITVLLQAVQATSLYVALRVLGLAIPYFSTLLMGVLTNLATFVRITPGALGVREAVTGLAASLAGYETAQGLSAALVTRAAQSLVTLTLGPVMVWALARLARVPARSIFGGEAR